MKLLTPVLTLLLICNVFLLRTYAQEENSLVCANGKKYVTLRTRSLEKYNTRIQRQQERLLKQLKKKEKKLASKLQRKDSTAYVRFQEQKLSYDSIGRLVHADSVTKAKFAIRKNATIDTLRGISGFIEKKSGGVAGYNNPDKQKLNDLQSDLNYQNHINDLITQRSNSLKRLLPNYHFTALTSIEKKAYYGKQKMAAFKQIEEEPTKTEEEALEYLQGTPGFDKTMSRATIGPNSMQSLDGNAGVEELQKMGIQTKSEVQNRLKDHFGNDLSGLSKNMGSQIKDWQDKTKDLNKLSGNVKDAKQTFKNIKRPDKPSFKVNPMRGLPFCKRIERQYNFQTTRAAVDGSAPALLDLSAMAGFKHTPKLTYGVGLVASFGLGQNWNNVHLTFEGLGLRTYAEWKWQYGIGAYAGYERMFKHAAFANDQQTQNTDAGMHSTSQYSESILIGLTKTYHVNNKWNGGVQLLYDVWWQQKGLRTPFVLRFSTISN